MVFLGWLLGIVVAIVVIAIVVVFLNRFYRKSTRDVALVRTGFGGQRIVISGGCLALPFLHKIDEINMRTIRVEVRRAGDKSLITVDRIRVDVELEFYVRVQPTVEGIATAAQAIGSRSFNPEGIRNLLEGRFVDALQSVAAAETMDSLHEKRGEFVRHVAEQLRENLSVERRAARLGVADPPGPGVLRGARREQRLQRGGDAQAGRDHRQQQEAAHADRGRRRHRGAADPARGDQAPPGAAAGGGAGADRPAPGDREDQGGERGRDRQGARAGDGGDRERAHRRASARPARWRSPSSASCASSRSRRSSAPRCARSTAAIQLAAKHVEEARAQAQAELARTEIVLAQEHVQTERERAVADRSREMAGKRVQEEGEVASANAETEAGVLIRRAQAEAQAIRARAEAERARLLAESEGSTARIKAENSRTESLMHLELERYRLDKLPEIVAQMMKPAEKIDSIRIHQVSGLGGAPGSRRRRRARRARR